MKRIAPLVLALWSATSFAAAPVPAAPFGNAMLLQRNTPVPVWGRADAGANVTVTFGSQTKSTTANLVTGDWSVVLDPMQADETARVMTIASGLQKTLIKDVLVGEVWICSGQSNMELPVSKTPMQQEALSTSDDGLRIRLIKRRPSDTPLTDLSGSSIWLHATPSYTPNFSAVAVAFGKALRRELKVPVGLVGAYWGGTRIEAWTPVGALPFTPSPVQTAAHQKPAALYNGMVHPWAKYAMRGMVWYQGESNCMQDDGLKYTDRMKALVGSWRQAWGREDFPICFTQIAPFRYTNLNWLPPFWDAQVAAAREIPDAFMAHTHDVGEWYDIHPINKQPVGERLARLALSRTYGVPFLNDNGPEFKALRIENGKAVISFNHAESGLLSRDGKPLGPFEIAGADGRWVFAYAEIRGDEILLSAASVQNPTQARLGMRGTLINLANGEGLPAAPFSAKVEAPLLAPVDDADLPIETLYEPLEAPVIDPVEFPEPLGAGGLPTDSVDEAVL